MKTVRGLALRLVLLVLNLSLLFLGTIAASSQVGQSPPPRTMAAPAPVQDLHVPNYLKPPISVVAAPAAEVSGIQGLRGQIENALASSTASTKGAVVWIDGFGTVFEENSNLELLPASTQKMFVGAAALKLLGDNHAFSTRVMSKEKVTADGTVDGDLVLVGGGDPSLSRIDVENLAKAVALSGIRTVSGGVLADESHFDRLRAAPGWKDTYVPRQSGALSALAVDQNSYRNDPEFIAEPALANAQLFREMLVAAGVAVTAPAGISPSPHSAGVVIARKDSPPLRDLVGHMLIESDNFFAEMILKEVGFSAGNASTSGGIDVIRRFASSWGLPLGPSADGSGLSQQNRQSAAAQIQWLAWIDQELAGAGFHQMLARSCSTIGTLKRRMCESPAAGRVLAKSGGLPHVATLSGYTTTASGRHVRFTFLLTDAASTKSARLAIDNALGAIAAFAE
ncbi:MAG: D-alanyl-D-alanine carboxypeptidase [Actinobacteria bacterium]|nr:D-alanyl-D-alanine carboxypeptidase [Actinomycetota bacterium]